METNLIFFDLETTGLGPHTEIIQIGAVSVDGKPDFCQYILPIGSISAGASEVNGITKSGQCLYKNGQMIEEVVKPRDGLARFLQWLEYMKRRVGNRLYLVAHNGHRFDAPVLINNFLRHDVANLSDIRRLVRGFGDSMDVFNSIFGKKQRLVTLIRHYGIRLTQSHDALGDAKDLKEVMARAQRDCDVYSLLNFVKPKDISLA